jgi:uncharacterized protein YeaO (DUF488 family)
MLKQASVSQFKAGIFPRDKSHLVITMRFYPRFLKKELRDEFLCSLAPEKQLLHDFNAAQRKSGDHNSAFGDVDYEHRFQLSEKGEADLKRLAHLSKTKDVYLACICAVGQRCHREILMLMAQELYNCPVGEVFHTYPDFMKRFSPIAARR